MNDYWIFITGIIAFIAIAAGIIIAIISLSVRKKSYKEPDYQSLFTLGVIFMGTGFVLSLTINNPAFLGILALGFIYMLIGLANMNKWKKK